MRGDEQRAAASSEVLLDPLERADVEMVRRLVEEQQVRVGDDEPCERGAGLLAARQRGRRPDPVGRLESEPGQRLVDALIDGVPAEDVELVLEVGVAALLDAMLAARIGRARPPIVSRCAAPARTAARRSGAAMNAASKCDSWASRPSVSPRFRATSPPSGSSTPAAIRSSVVFPAPFGPTSPMRSPTAIAAVIESRMTNVPTSRLTPVSRRIDTAQPPTEARAAARRVAAACRVRSVRASRAVRSADVSPTLPSLGRQLRPSRAAPLRRRRRCEDPPRAGPIGGRQPLAPRAEMRRPPADDDPPDGPAAAQAGLVGPLVDREVLLHLAVAVGRRVVVDRRAAPDHRLGEDPPEVRPETPLVGRPQRRRGPQRVEPRRPERLVGVDVADARDERLVEQQRLEATLASPQSAPERRDRERVGQRLRARPSRTDRPCPRRTARSGRTCGRPGTGSRGRPRARTPPGRTDPAGRPGARRTAGRSSSGGSSGTRRRTARRRAASRAARPPRSAARRRRPRTPR